MLAYRCLLVKWWAAVTIVAIPSQKALWMCPYVFSGKCSVLAPRCPRALLHNLQLTSDRFVIFASHLATGMIPAIAIISRLLYLQGKHGSFKCFPKNALLSFCRNMKSAVHVPYAVWLILPCSALACTHDFKDFLSSIQVFCCKTFTMLWYVSYRCLCVQSSMYITFTTLFISSPDCAHLSPSTCKPLFLFLHLILRCPSPYCIPHAIIPCQMNVLISYFPCLVARFFPRKDCSIRLLAALFAYFRIWNSLIRQNVGSLIRWFSSLCFYFDQEDCCPCCNPLS